MTNAAASRQYGRSWKEVYCGGSPETEARQFATFTDQIKRVQDLSALTSGAGSLSRCRGNPLVNHCEHDIGKLLHELLFIIPVVVGL